MARIGDQVDRGESFAEAIRKEGNYFPRQFQSLVSVGERTGRLDVVLLKSAEFYDNLIQLRGLFLVSIIWPVLQLLAALAVVGLLIWIMGFLAPSPSTAVDILGFGLIGNRGLMIYGAIIAAAVVSLWLVVELIRRGFFVSSLSNLLMSLPAVGPALRVVAQLRFTRAMALAIDAGLDAWNAVDLAFQCTQTPFFMRHAANAKKAIRSGQEIHVTLNESRVFSQSLIDAVQVGEQSGRLAESLETHAKQLDHTATNAFRALAVAASVAVWLAVVVFIVFLIFRVASFYFRMIDDALQGFE
jgi:type II secretory pathway component PulF